MPTHCTNGYTHCVMVSENIIDSIIMFWRFKFNKDIFKYELDRSFIPGKLEFCEIQTEWFKNNVPSSKIGKGVLND